MRKGRRSFLKMATVGFALAPFQITTSAFSADDIGEDFQIPDFSGGNRAVRFWPSDEPVPEEGYVVPALNQYSKIIADLTGPKNPYPSEIKLGNKLIDLDIPTRGVTPYEIAYRFHQWRRGEVGRTKKHREIYSAYAREWPVRGNPIIMRFFTEATGFRNPRGDTTYWCSAFVCWCIQRSRSEAGDSSPVWPKKNGAASAAFRSWGKETTSPTRGDLAVFKRTDSTWAGHVGFVHDLDDKHVFCLGGNQGAQNDYNGGEVNVAKFPRSQGGRLVLHSFRTSDFLHTKV